MIEYWYQERKQEAACFADIWRVQLFAGSETARFIQAEAVGRISLRDADF